MVYLNNAATSYPKPPVVLEAIRSCLESPPIEPGRSGFSATYDITGMCRREFAALINAPSPETIVFTSGATEALNLAILGSELQGTHVVTTALEHTSVLRPLTTLQDRHQIDLTIVPCDEQGQVEFDAITSAFNKRTSLLAICHCSNVTGTTLDIDTIVAHAHQRGIRVLVDASQSAGQLPIDASRWQADYVAFAGHKYLFGISGIGVLYVHPDAKLAPIKTGGTGTRSDLLTQPPERPVVFEAGTPNIVGIASLLAGIRFLEDHLETHATICGEYVARMKEELAGIDRVTVIGNQLRDKAGGSTVCINIEGLSSEDVAYMLAESFGIIVRGGLHCAPLVHKAMQTYPEGAVRVSPSILNHENEIEQFIQAVRTIAADASN